MSGYPIPRKNPDRGDKKFPGYPEGKNPESQVFRMGFLDLFTRDFYGIFAGFFRDFQDFSLAILGVFLEVLKCRSRFPGFSDFRDFFGIFRILRSSSK